MTDYDDIDSAIRDRVARDEDIPDGTLVMSWVLSVAVVSADGAGHVRAYASEDQYPWAVVGLLDTTMNIARRRMG